MQYSLTLPIGAKHADQMVIEGEGHQLPGTTTGVLVCILRCAKHALYQRVGADFVCTWKLSLREALCGFTLRLPHFNKQVLVIKGKPGEVVQHDTTKVIFGKGLCVCFVSFLFFFLFFFHFGLFFWVLDE